MGRRFLLAGILIAAAVAAASAQPAAPPAPQVKPEMNESCPGLVASRPGRAGLQLAALTADQVRLTYAGHSTFLIESPQLVRIGTDYNDWVKPPILPDIATMNHAHSTHFTNPPDAGI